MAVRPDWRRIGATSATLSAGALTLFAAGTGPASADTGTAAPATQECKLGTLLCGILGAGSGTPTSPPPKPSGGGTSSKPSSAPAARTGGRSRPHPKPAAAAHHSSGGGTTAVPPPAGGVPGMVPNSTQTPALPDVTTQDPLVLPEAAPDGQDPAARPAALAARENDTVPPLLVATASGLIGALAALNLSVLRLRRQRTGTWGTVRPAPYGPPCP